MPVSKKPRKPRRTAERPTDAPSSSTPKGERKITLRQRQDGSTHFVPRSVDRLDEDARRLAYTLRTLAEESAEIDRAIGRTAAAARSAGLSWSQIGFMVGMTGEGARRRFGSRPPA